MPSRMLSGIVMAALGLCFLMAAASPKKASANDKATAAMKTSLGESLFFDTSLSEPPGQACSSCHDPENHFANPKRTMIAEGAVPGRFGNRKPPSLAYAAFSPAFHFDPKEKDYVGGYFWDGRAKSLKEQARGPFMNPAEMNNSTRKQVVDKVEKGASAELFRRVYGQGIFKDRDRAFYAITEAISAFEKSGAFRPFSSKYDAYLRGEAKLTKQELHGLKVFESEKLGNCAACHPSKPGPKGEPPLFTDFTYDNIGLARNEKSPFLRQPKLINPEGQAFVDAGLESTTSRPEDRGRFKVPTLRNVAATGPYFHHSGIGTLKDAILFYSVRDSGKFGKPEVPKTMNRKELGSLYLTAKQVDDLEAFLKTLTDGYMTR